jgi:hypothetical protein
MERKATVSDMVQAIEKHGRPCTKRDIADECGVSRQTIQNHQHELEEDERVAYGPVGTATAYWLAEWTEDDETEDSEAPEAPAAETDETGDAEPERRSWFAALGARKTVLTGVAVCVFGYLHLLPASLAASRGFGTVALGLLLLTTVFAFLGVALVAAAVVSNLTLLSSSSPDVVREVAADE